MMASNTCYRIAMLFCFLLYLNEIQTIEIFGGKRNNLRSEVKRLKKITSNLEDSVKALENDINTRINALARDVHSKLEELEGDIDSLRSDVRDILTRTGEDDVFNSTDTTVYGQSAKKGCPLLQLANAMVSPATAVAHGSTVVVECWSPFTLVGNSKPECNDGGFTDVPSCDNLDIFDITDMHVTDKTHIDIESPTLNEPWDSAWVVESKFLPDDRLIIAESKSFTVQLFSSDFILQESLSFRDGWVFVFAISVINDTTVVVTEPHQNRIEFLQYAPSLQRGPTFSTASECYAVDVYDDTIYVACNEDRIRRYHLDGKFKGTVGDPFEGPYSIAVSPISENICVADWNLRSVTCINQAGYIVFTYTHQNLSRPQALLLDDVGNIVIADWDNDDVQVISISDKSNRRTLLTPDDGINNPYSLAYRRSDKTLVVGLQWTNWIDAFKFI